MFENIKTLINYIDNGSFQILLKYGSSFSNVVSEEDTQMVQIGKNRDSRIEFNKDIEVVFRFLSFEEDFSTAVIPAVVG